ncbi:MAG: ABC transporter ATP-binding protein [Planctomycetes bacterium]|nr:ABC transporter ATP-binding protein [Planctomycetota bacterium]
MAEREFIRIEDLRFSYEPEEFALRIPSLSVARGERLALIGPSGCGKTTLLSLIAGILLPRSGRIEVDGLEVPGLSDAERRRFRIGRIGLIFQEFELLDHLTVRENILLPYYVNGALRLDGAVTERAERLAGTLGIDHGLARRPSALSHGERQRVAVGRALITEPALLLADEPTGNLDPKNREAILDLVFSEAATRGATLLMVTHDHSFLPRFDRVVDFERFGAEGAAR